MRLDEILLDDGIVSLNQINEAFEYQRDYGGRLENHLYRFGYAGEKELLNSLSRQFQCKSVNLNNIKIPAEVLDLIPAEVAWYGLLLPFEYDAVRNVLKIACENPHDEYLKEELEEFIPGKNIELYLSLGSVLRCAIIEHYRHTVVDLDFGEFTGEEEPEEIDSRDESEEPVAGADDDNEDSCSLLLYSDLEIDQTSLKNNLKHQGFVISESSTIDEFVKVYNLKRPDIVIFGKVGEGGNILDFLADIDSRGIAIDKTTSYLINDNLRSDELSAVLELGIEDVVPSSNILDLLVIKLGRTKSRILSERNKRVEILQDLGTHGSLADMNVIDLIQVLGPTRKTARLDITACGQQLVIYLDQGNIIYAECEDRSGPEAVYQGIPWSKGIWSIVPVSDLDLPEPNNNLSNDAIMLEGCRLIDELNKTDEPIGFLTM